MARTPRATVSKTSGQGTSRLAYQKTRALTKNANVPQIKGPGAIGQSPSTYAKGGPTMTPMKSDPMNVSYGDTFDPTDIADITGADPKRPPRNPPRGLNVSGGVKTRPFK